MNPLDTDPLAPLLFAVQHGRGCALQTEALLPAFRQYETLYREWWGYGASIPYPVQQGDFACHIARL